MVVPLKSPFLTVLLSKLLFYMTGIPQLSCLQTSYIVPGMTDLLIIWSPPPPGQAFQMCTTTSVCSVQLWDQNPGLLACQTTTVPITVPTELHPEAIVSNFSFSSFILLYAGITVDLHWDLRSCSDDTDIQAGKISYTQNRDQDNQAEKWCRANRECGQRGKLFS